MNPSKDGSEAQQAALAYAALGWSVVPIVPRGKRPLVSWEEFQSRRAGSDEIRTWFKRWPGAGVGVVTGFVSGLLVLDVDPRHGGEDSLAELCARHGALPVTVEAVTGSGGRHLYFRHPGHGVANRAGFAPGLDLRGDGGLVVAPPSGHPSGGHYRWAPGRDPQSLSPADMPGWLLSDVPDTTGGAGWPAAYWRELVRSGVGEGARNNTIASFAGHLLHRGVDIDVVIELLLCWNAIRCRPPLPDEEVVATVHSIRRTQLRHAEREEPPG
ncbi:bifunctional DNA primase/polymerase [Ferruginivarius sediminum]|uniref:DNA primase n=1 Tax=Ferruginivarius sediminum TaxID=2661937 RepID=A0A369T6T5_9PROT|nr:bifunctional DNA primase/polymerase [Ferruginivarius sediminum]RDD61039.1 DNA primase [Ferruginivarius sediminum]